MRITAQLLAVSLFVLGVVRAQEIKITGGIAAFQVVQRDADNRGSIRVSGTSAKIPNNKYIEAKVFKGQAQVAQGVLTEPVRGNKWAGEIKAPVGGPYRVELSVSGMPKVADSVENVLVGDLWVLAGQSNMEGVGDLVDTAEPVEWVHSFTMVDTWEVAREPLHRLRSAIDPVHWPANDLKVKERWTFDREEKFYAERKKGAGLGLPFATEMYRRSAVPVGLIPCAHGGTSMTQWSPADKAKGGESLYGSTIRRITAVGGKVRGILWYQGESDANPEAVEMFPAKFAGLVEAFRKDLNAPELPFYYVQIGRYINAAPAGPWNKIQEYQRQAESKIAKTGMVASVDASLDDLIHVGTQDLKRLGRRLALLAARDMFGTTPEYANVKRGPRPVSAKLDKTKQTLTVKFSDVNGSLVAEGRISGFSIHDASGAPVPMIFRASFDAKDPTSIIFHLIGNPTDKISLSYGYGRDPYCNVRDTQDLALPAFSGLAIQ